MKVLASFSGSTFGSKAEGKPTAADGSAEAADEQYKEAMRQHKKAMEKLRSCADSLTKALAGLAKSFQRFAAETRAPVVIQASGALVRGVEEVRDGTVLDALRQQISMSLSSRFRTTALEHAELEGSRKRKTKAGRALAEARSQCAKLRLRKDGDERCEMIYLAAAQRCDEQEIECSRLTAELEDARCEFTQNLGLRVYEDMTLVTTKLHELLSSLSYQYRKCEEHLKAHPVPGFVDVAALKRNEKEH
ncbi:hypothetical protein ABB37_06493 [Leptomonas pyrrhocoris]|uniref:BAR domain-containing protein n=1 Tax=Leptomonas pyrrhocoris TaxID=157538 RepID=A0A0M9FYB3_LEPPY|nr:hypothetical protein ABB37_06493 [Leptomonas pyrrhocoris]XP_015656815.1 hypothetical protein ABB37_06493 [Leptomonas pyrrhocoris]KPA78375.1 hypothetical protein ABB37_06493 [Leptomonas pyrrhocoris]KPA78376.1 hypothetical protein ABB37_06493 [Leptomonas pyrrhocoris]|eukprot:XP_015656814.1 hypothetical protein ABB37_06493 [Leptomonas pyrrhocoris]